MQGVSRSHPLKLRTLTAAAPRALAQGRLRAFSLGTHTPSAPWPTAAAVDGFLGAVGNTPLIRLPKLSARTGRNILAKAEFMNPGGSVKDRAALAIVLDAEGRGQLKPGGTVVEGTAGNTGIGLAHICRARGYRCVIYMPNTQSKEKIDTLKALGCEVHAVPAVAFTDPQNYNHQAKRAAESIQGAVWTNQFDNTANRVGHYRTTGPEIWRQTAGAVDAFVCATGTGGTLAGTARYLKEQKPSVKIFCADPPGSVLFAWYTKGVMGERAGSSITEGIGQGRLTDNLKDTPVDGAVLVDDSRSVAMVFSLLHEEGIGVGASSALNVVAAVDVAAQLPPGSNIVTILCDSAARYQSRLFSRKWLESKGMLGHVPPECSHYLGE